MATTAAERIEGQMSVTTQQQHSGSTSNPILSPSRSTNNTTELEIKNARITQSILEWYESWQIWQKKILITGIVNRFEYSQLRGLLMAVESVFHKDFATTVKKIYPVPRGEENAKMRKSENIFEIKRPSKTKTTIEGEEQVTVDDTEAAEQTKCSSSSELLPVPTDATRIPSPVISSHGSRIRTTSGSEMICESSHVLSPIAEGVVGGQFDADPSLEVIDEGPGFGEVAHTAMLISHLMSEVQSPNTSQVSTLVSSLSPIEETSPESTASGESERLFQLLPLKKSSVEVQKAEEAKIKERDEKRKGKKKKRKKKEKSIPETVVKKIASFSVLVNRPVSSNVSLTPIGIESSLSLDFHSGVSSAQVRTDDFFTENDTKALLGRPATTLSKMGQDLMSDYDATRNHAPLPTTQQLYKGKKLWNRDTVDSNVKRLKELFREQLNQIWQWIDEWPAYRRSRLLLQLFPKSSQKMVHFAAECLKAKKMEAESLPPPIEMLTDEMLLKIFSYLIPTRLFEASYVCKRWFFILNSDELWKQKCDEIGTLYGISNLARLLGKSAANNQALDWKQAYMEVSQYLTLNLEQGGDEPNASSEESEESEIEEEVERYPDYIPYWKAHPPEERTESRKKSAKQVEKQEVVQIPSSEPEIEDIKEDLNLDDARSDACYDADMFADMQEWDDVGLLANIGQRFAVDFIVQDAMASCARNWPIEDHVLAVRKVQVFKGHTGSVNVVRAQGGRIFSGSSDRCVRVWDRSGQSFAKMTEGLKGGISDISISDVDGPKVMVTASWDMSIRIWNTVTFRLKGTLTGHKGSVRKVAADNKFIVSCSHDGTIKVWDRQKWKCERTLTFHKGEVDCMIYHDRLIISGGIDKLIHVSNSFTGRLIRTFSGHKTPITALQKQHDLLASGDMEGKVYFWSLANSDDRHVDMIKAHESQINAIFMHGPTFFTASKDALVKEWDLITMTLVRIFQGHTDSITDVQWTEKYLLTASRDNDVRVWWWRGTETEEGSVDET